jgi:hypothetical protein
VLSSLATIRARAVRISWSLTWCVAGQRALSLAGYSTIDNRPDQRALAGWLRGNAAVRTNRASQGELYTPGASAARLAVERLSAMPLAYLNQLPGLVPSLGFAALVATGLAVRGWVGAAALCVLAAMLGWLAFLSWPTLAGRGRTGRIAVIACLLGVAVLQATR